MEAPLVKRSDTALSGEARPLDHARLVLSRTKRGITPAMWLLMLAVATSPGKLAAQDWEEKPWHSADPSNLEYELRDTQALQPIVESVRVDGSPRTRPTLIKRVLGIEPGDPLDEQAIELGRQRLMDLGLFVKISLRLERGEMPGRVILVVDVAERGSLLISNLFLGFTNVTPFYGGFGLADANVAGTGLLAHGAFVLGTDGRQSYRVALSSSSLSSWDLFTSVGLLHLDGLELHCPLGLSTCEDEQFSRMRYRRTGGRASIGFASGAFSRTSFHYRYEDLSASFEEAPVEPDDPTGAFVASALPYLEPGSSRLSTLTVAFEHDTSDEPFLARRGRRLDVSAEVGSHLFYSDYEYSRYDARVAMFFSGLREHSIRLTLFGGFVQGEAPFFDRFHVADHSYFTIGANAVPRALGLSFTEVSQYDDVLVAADMSYRIPLRVSGRHIYKGYVFASTSLTLSAHTVDGSLLDLSLDPRNEISLFPLSGDLGVSLDTSIGVFSLGISYPLDLLL